MSVYREDIIDLYKNPLNQREIQTPDIAHSGANVLCGDRVRIYLKLADNDDGKIVADASFNGEGCAISIAAASLLTEEIKGMKLEDVLGMNTESMLGILGLTLGPARIKCGVLCLETVQEGIRKVK
ncbi:MAG: Iron-sulfur cluster assembly protein [Candidatus Peregrinibacteria bacterium GW2011_GWA2_47_7]|nr:MAG: Iron-sulfur cluster assembly protein [Candidatus Peregrinibacteria bacterium GW2011_GWA2_47_7]